MKIDTLLLDLDGVLATPHEQYCPDLRELIRNLRSLNIDIRIATARSYAMAWETIAWYELSDTYHVFDAGCAARSQASVIFTELLDDSIPQDLFEMLKLNSSRIPFQFSTAEQTFANEACVRRLSLYDRFITVYPSDSVPNQVISFGVRGLSQMDTLRLRAHFENRCAVEIHRRESGTNTVFFRKTGSSKLSGLLRLDRAGLMSLKNAAFIGDDATDCELFRYLKRTGAPSNADSSIKELAGFVSTRPYQNGCIEAIKQLTLITQL